MGCVKSTENKKFLNSLPCCGVKSEHPICPPPTSNFNPSNVPAESMVSKNHIQIPLTPNIQTFLQTDSTASSLVINIDLPCRSRRNSFSNRQSQRITIHIPEQLSPLPSNTTKFYDVEVRLRNQGQSEIIENFPGDRTFEQLLVSKDYIRNYIQSLNEYELQDICIIFKNKNLMYWRVKNEPLEKFAEQIGLISISEDQRVINEFIIHRIQEKKIEFIPKIIDYF